LYHTKNPDRCNWSGLQPKTRYFNLTTWAPIKYLSCDHIVTWSIRRLSSFIRSFTSRIQIRDPTITRWVTIKNPRISRIIWCYVIVTQRILVQSQIWMQEVKQGVNLDNLRINHVAIRSELRYLIGARVGGTVKWTHGPGNSPALVSRFGLLGRSWPGPGPSVRFQPGPKPGNPEPLLTITISTSFATSSIQALNIQKEWLWIKNYRTNNRIITRLPSRYCEIKLERRYYSIKCWMLPLQNYVVTMTCRQPNTLWSKW
jgi:hypothetical protein